MIYILLPVHNRKAITEKLVLCLKQQTHQSFRLVLIDDGSTDGTREMVASYLPDTAVLRGKGDWWWGGSLQQGFEWLKKSNTQPNDLVLIINDDVELEPDYLDRGVRLMRDRAGVLLLSQYKDAHGEISESGVYADLEKFTFSPARVPNEINCLSTRGLYLYWADFQRIGGFYPRLLPHYLSDYEFTIRAFRKGFKCETHPELFIVPNHETTGYHKIEERDFLKFLKKYFSKRSANNPVYWSTFILLVAERKTLVTGLLRFWREALRTVLRAYRTSRA